MKISSFFLRLFGKQPAPPTITFNMLLNRGACSTQLRKFLDVFGDSVEITESLVEKYAGHFDVYWAARNLLKRKSLIAYFEIEDQAHKQRAQKHIEAFDTRDALEKTAKDCFFNALTSLEYKFDGDEANYGYYLSLARNKQTFDVAAARADYDATVKTLRREYNVATARAFVTLYIADNT